MQHIIIVQIRALVGKQASPWTIRHTLHAVGFQKWVYAMSLQYQTSELAACCSCMGTSAVQVSQVWQDSNTPTVALVWRQEVLKSLADAACHNRACSSQEELVPAVSLMSVTFFS